MKTPKITKHEKPIERNLFIKDKPLKVKPTQFKTNLKYLKEDIYEIAYPIRDEGYTIEDMRQLINKGLKKYKGLNLKAMVSQKIREIGEWKSAKSFNVDKEELNIPSVYRHIEYTTVPQFTIFYWKDKTLEGGDDKHNDCFYICLLKGLNFEEIHERYNSPRKFKKRLDLERDAKVPISLISIIETKLKININVEGDANYISANKFQKTINLKLFNEHYTLKTNLKKRYLLNGYTFDETKLNMFS